MGTRSLTRIYDEDGDEIVCIYRQMDGYPSGHGQELADLLKGFTVVNGLGGDTTKVANGYGCLAAQVVKELKDGPGSIYLYPPGTSNVSEEYEYHVKPAPGAPRSSSPLQRLPGPVIAVFEIHWTEVKRGEARIELKKLFECSPIEFEKVRTTYEALAERG